MVPVSPAGIHSDVLDPPENSIDISPEVQPADLPVTRISESLPPCDTPTSSNKRRFFLDVCCGHRAPLSTAVQSLGGDVIQFDILLHSADDLLDDAAFSKLLKLAASGSVAYCACSPSCCEYSRLKLKPGGPPALRSPEHLDGIPGISSDDLCKVQESNLMLERCIQLLQLVISSGGHGHLEQPSSAMSWEEPAVREFIRAHSCSCIYVAACGYGKDWYKSWMFASTFSDLQAIAYQCQHPSGSHQSIVGIRTQSGHFLSRDTAEYPDAYICRDSHGKYHFAFVVN